MVLVIRLLIRIRIGDEWNQTDRALETAAENFINEITK